MISRVLRKLACTAAPVSCVIAQLCNSAHAFDDEKLDALIRKWGVPGAAIAVVKAGDIMLSRGYGFVDRENSRRVDPDKTVFRIASVSKPITAAAVMKLVSDGTLSVDAKVFDILSEYSASDSRAREITVRQLLDMTAGWDKQRSGDPILQPFISRAARKMNVASPADFDITVRYVLRRKLDFAPGSRFAYSNFEYGLLGKLIEKVSGKPYANYVRDALLAPADVSLSEAHTREADRLADEVAYYAPKEKDRRSFFTGDPRRVAAPYARAYLEEDLPMIGWAGSATQLALLMDYLLRDASVRETICAGGSKHFSMGWEVKRIDRSTAKVTPNPMVGATREAGLDERKPATAGVFASLALPTCEFFKDGTLPGTRAFAMRTADGITWVALFNARPTQKQPDPFARELRQIMASVSSSPAPTTKASERQTLP